ESGKIYTTREIAAGAQAKLTPLASPAVAAGKSLRGIYKRSEWLEEFHQIEADPAPTLKHNCYLATLDAAPFVEPGLSGVKTVQAKTLVYGIRSAKPMGRAE